MKPIPLFRSAAVSARQAQWLGNIVLVRPASFRALTTFVAIGACFVILFLHQGSYTKRTTIAGQLVPDMGLVKIYAPQAGIVLQRNIDEGQRVAQGDVLFTLSIERQNGTQGGTQAAISRQVESRERSLREELRKTLQLQQTERMGLSKKIQGLQAELLKIEAQIDSQTNRIKLAEEAVNRSQDLMAQHFISREQVQQKEGDLLDQRTRLQAVERDRMAIQRELVGQQNDLESLPLRHQNQIAQIERVLTTTGQELTESEARRVLLITAPKSGIATAATVDVGQAVEPGKPLVSVVPNGASLQAQLYAPSRAVGFVKAGDPVLLRYQAYPYQKFGHAKGRVAFVSLTALPNAELSSVANLSGNNSEPMYRITVNLDTQVVTVYGRPQTLQSGMLLDADVLQESRRLYEWVLEPLYSLSGKL